MMLTGEKIQKNFGGVKALNTCSFKIPRNKIVAIIGPNGSGKSTLFNVISHLLECDHGSIIFENKDITNSSDVEIAKLGISRTFQEVRLFRNLTIQEHLEIALSETDESLLRSITFVFKETGGVVQRSEEILEFVGLNKPLDTLVSDLSYGQRKLLDMAVAIAKPHKLLLLDEPVAGVNYQLRNEIKKMLKRLNARGETIVVIEHDMNFVMDLADHVIVMDYGEVIAEDKPRRIQNDPRVLSAYLGE